MQKSTKYGLVGVVVVAVLAFIISGVLASTSITVNSDNKVSLGAGAAFSAACDSAITATPLTTFNSTNGTYQITTISISDIGDDRVTGGPTTCEGKTLNLAFLHSSSTYAASWTLPSDNTANQFHFGSKSGGISGSTYFATATFSALSAAGLTSIAVSIN